MDEDVEKPAGTCKGNGGEIIITRCGKFCSWEDTHGNLKVNHALKRLWK